MNVATTLGQRSHHGCNNDATTLERYLSHTLVLPLYISDVARMSSESYLEVLSSDNLLNVVRDQDCN